MTKQKKEQTYQQTHQLSIPFPYFDDVPSIKQEKHTILSNKKQKLIKGLVNPQLKICHTDVEGKYEMPILRKYTGPLPNALIPFSEVTSNKCNRRFVPHFFVDDKVLCRIWNNPQKYIQYFKTHPCILGVDFSQFIDADLSVNIWNIYRNRVLSDYFSSHGINVIPSYSIGNANTIDANIDGLPEESIICMGNISQTKQKELLILKKKAMERLIERKRPTTLIIYGWPLEFTLPIEIKYYECLIQKLRIL